MEHQHYVIPVEKAAQHIKHIVPKRAIVHYWYEVPESSPEDVPVVTPIGNSMKNSQLNAFLHDMEESGGLLPEDVEMMDKHSKEFRENFDL